MSAHSTTWRLVNDDGITLTVSSVDEHVLGAIENAAELADLELVRVDPTFEPPNVDEDVLGQDGLCRSCGKPIAWRKTPQDRFMPLDLEPVADGNIWLDDGVAVHVHRAGPPPGVVLYVSHFKTCPDRDEWRQR